MASTASTFGDLDPSIHRLIDDMNNTETTHDAIRAVRDQAAQLRRARECANFPAVWQALDRLDEARADLALHESRREFTDVMQWRRDKQELEGEIEALEVRLTSDPALRLPGDPDPKSSAPHATTSAGLGANVGAFTERAALAQSASRAPLHVPRARVHEQAILDAAATLGYDPKALPKVKNGQHMGHAKQAIRRVVVSRKPTTTSEASFDKGWQSLRRDGRLCYARPGPLRPWDRLAEG